MNKDKEYIDNFRKIKIKNILEELKIDSSNFYSNKISEISLHKIKEKLEEKIKRL